MSTCERMQFTHMLEGLGWMLQPHRQQSLSVLVVVLLCVLVVMGAAVCV